MYLSVTAAPEPGWALNLTSLSFDLASGYDLNSLDNQIAVAGRTAA